MTCVVACEVSYTAKHCGAMYPTATHCNVFMVSVVWNGARGLAHCNTLQHTGSKRHMEWRLGSLALQ